MAVIVKAQDREKGIVFLDPSRADVQATHVMIVGVGRFQSNQVKAVTSPPKSALAVADWFLGRNGARGFSNSERPLGSLAMAISGEDNDAPTNYAGAAVPRAKFALVKAAVSAWVGRINTNKENLAILYVCSHGESLGTKTGFLLEEYDTDRHDRTAGLAEIRQFGRAMENAIPVRQLLIFDCCRTPTSMNLPLDEEFGSKLISLSRASDDHGETRQQWMFAATALGEESTGRKNMTTVFTDSLLRSLKGAAADPSGGKWSITPADLLRTIPKFLELHRREHEPMQTPNGIFANPFDICFSEEPTKVQTYLALKDHARWAGCRLTVTGDSEIVLEGEDPPGPERFAVAEVDELRPINIVAKDKSGVEIGKARRKPRAPADYVIIGATDTVSVETSPAGPGPDSGGTGGGGPGPQSAGPGGPNATIKINARGVQRLPNASVIKLERIGGDKPELLKPELLDIAWPDAEDSNSLTVEPGTYRVAVETPDGRNFTTMVDAGPGSVTRIALDSMRSPQEWLRGVWATGLVTTPGEEGVLELQQLEDVKAQIISRAEVLARTNWGHASLVGRDINTNQLGLSLEPYRQDRFRGFRASWTGFIESAVAPPAWAAVSHGSVAELCAIPFISFGEGQGEPVSVVVDRKAPADSAATSVAVESDRWTPLLGYLAKRNFAAGEVVFGASQEDIRKAVQQKVGNPYGAAAAALIAVGSGRFEGFKIDEQWLRNLSNWFDAMPDGAIILARHLAASPKIDERTKARGLLLEAYRRGIPAYSLALEWLDAGLARLFDAQSDEEVRANRSLDPEAHEASRVVRRVATRVDPGKPFTTIRLGAGGKIE